MSGTCSTCRDFGTKCAITGYHLLLEKGEWRLLIGFQRAMPLTLRCQDLCGANR